MDIKKIKLGRYKFECGKIENDLFVKETCIRRFKNNRNTACIKGLYKVLGWGDFYLMSEVLEFLYIHSIIKKKYTLKDINNIFEKTEKQTPPEKTPLEIELENHEYLFTI